MRQKKQKNVTSIAYFIYIFIPESVKMFDHDLKQDFLKPGFEESIRDIGKQMKPQDTDLDGE